MTAEVEKRIVEMRFENEQFEKAAGQTLTTLGKLDGILDIMGEAGAEQLVRTLDKVQYRFSSFGIAAASIIENVTGKVVNLTASLLSAIPNQIISGGINRALNLEEAQFRLEGLGAVWEHIQDDMEYAVNETAYGLDEAAQAASILASSQIIDWNNNVEGASDMAHALRAISGVASMTGSSYGDIAAVLTDVAAAGRLTGDVITRLAYRGLNLTAVLAKEMGKSQEEVKKMIDEGTLSVQEFYRVMDKAFGKHATEANNTYTGSLMNINAALSRIGADFIMPLHKWLIPINNSLRKMFNRLRDVTKPFAEGQYSSYLERISKKLEPIIDGINFDWIKPGLQLFAKLLGLIDKGIDHVTNFVNSLKSMFTVKHSLEETLESGDSQFWISKQAQARVEKLQKIFWMLKRAIQMAKDTLKLFGNAVGHLIGHPLQDFIDHVLDAGAALSDFYRANQGAIWVKIVSFMGGVEKAAISLHDTLAKAMTAIWTIISKTYVFLRDTGVFRFFGNVISGAFKIFGDILVWVSDKLGVFFATITDTLNEAHGASGALGLLGAAFRGIGDILGEIFGHLKNFTKLLFGLKEGESVFGFFAEKVKNAGKIIREVLGDMRKAITETLSDDSVGTEAIKIASAILSVLLGYRKIESSSWALERLERAMEFLTNILKEGYRALKSFNPVQWADDIETLLRRISGALRAFSDNLNAKSLLYIGGAVIALAFGLMMLASIVETGHLKSALIGLAGTMMILVAAIFALKKIMGTTSFGNTWVGFFKILQKGVARFLDAFTLKEMATAMIAIAGALAIMAVAIGVLAYVIDKYGIDKVGWAFTILAGCMIVLAVAMAALNKIFEKDGVFDSMKFIAIGAGMLLMAVAVGILALAMWGLSKLPWEDLLRGIVGVAAGMAILVLAMMALSKWAADPIVLFTAVAMIGIAAAVVIMAVAIGILSAVIAAFGWDGLIGLAAGLILLGGALALLSLLPAGSLLAAAGSMILMSVAMIGLAAAMLVFAISMGILTNLPWDNMTKNLDAFLAVCGMLLGAVLILTALGPAVLIGAAAIAIIGLAILAAGAGFAALNASLVSLAIALNMLEGLDLSTIGDGLKKVGKGLKQVAGAAFRFNFGNPEAFNYLPSLASAMLLLNDVDIPKLADKKTGLPALAHALNSFGGLFGTGMHLIFGDSGLLAAGPAFTSLAAGMTAIMPVLQAFEQMQNPDQVTNQIRDLITAMNTFQYWDNKTKQNMETGAECLEKITRALMYLDGDQIIAVAKLGNSLKMIDTDSAENVKLVATYMGELVKTIEAFGNTFIAHGENIMAQIRTGMNNGYYNAGGLKSQFRYLFTNLAYLAMDIADMRTWYNNGANIVYGIARGITNNSYVAQNALRQLAASLQQSFTVTLGIKSPSTVFERLAEYIPLGAARGIQNGEHYVTDATVHMMDEALQYLEAVGNSSELSPRISPVVDLNQMRSGYGAADQLFRNSPISSFAGVNGLNVNGDAINYNMQNKDVVLQLQSLEERITKLGDAIENLQLVMDTGMVVGALAPQMNSQLGVMAVREGRQ